MPNSLKIQWFGISGLLTFSISDVITPTVWYAATSGVTPYRHKQASCKRYSFKENKLYNIISATIDTGDIFHYFETKCFQNIAVQNIDRQGLYYAPTKAPLFEK